MSDEQPTSYDELPYESHPYESTHPDHLATMATLFGLDAPDVSHCRVLELGCAAGGNLIPQALVMPESSFVGIDLSQRQLEDGWRQVEQLGLTNIELQHRSIMDVGPADGEFDYIICHGVFSWVSREIQDQILTICSQNLVSNGVAYVSYNTYPGWFLRGMVRQMMCFHARQFDDAKTQVEQARAVLDFLINAGPTGDPTYHTLLVRELEILRNRHDSYLYHEHLEEENEPLFFYQFNERAEAAGLRYLAETQLSEMVPGNYSAVAERTLRELGVGLIHAEQYLDFLRNRTFRRTLLCHESVQLEREITTDRLKGLYVASRLCPEVSQIDLASHEGIAFVSQTSVKATVSDPLAKSALVQLQKFWPRVVPFDTLPSLAHEGFGVPTIREADHFAKDIETLGSLVLELYAADLIELHKSPPRFQTEVSRQPISSPLARFQLELGQYVTNLRHESTLR